MCNHRFKFLRQTAIIWCGKLFEVDIYECKYCHRFQIIDRENSKILSFNGMIGVEVNDW